MNLVLSIGLTHATVEDDVYEGYHIPKGTRRECWLGGLLIALVQTLIHIISRYHGDYEHLVCY